MKHETRKSYWFLLVIVMLLFVLAACVRPAPQPDVTETPVTVPAVEMPSPIPSTSTPLPESYPGTGETEPPPEGVTDPGTGEAVVETPPTAVPPGQPTTHIVQADETLSSLSQQYGVSQEEIAAANNITTSSVLTVGQALVIPAPGTTTTPPETQPPDQPPGEQVHVVQPGENLFRISLHYGKTVDEVAAYNGIANPHYIYPGQVIRIP